MRIILIFLCSIATASYAADIFSETTRDTTINGKPIAYTATVGSIPARDSSGKETGQIFYIAYRQEKGEETRPITFAFNGGPGSSSAWLHLGALGPKRILTPEEGQTCNPPYILIDNADSIFDLTDLVFIDPIGTGFSRVADEKDKSFYNMKGDIESVGNFICDFVTREGRWKSPKYIAGESYGTFRACGVSEYLLSRHGLYLNGLILISCAIDFQTIDFTHLDNDLPYSLYLPSFAATAWYHGKLDPKMSLEEVISSARLFALTNLAPALISNGVVPERLYGDMSTWTGLPLDFIQQQDGLIDDYTFFLQLLSDQKKVIGRFDSRCAGNILPPRTIAEYHDPSSSNIKGVFTAAIRAYLHDNLNCKTDFPRYEVLTDIGNRWMYHAFGFPSMMTALRNSFVINPSLKVFVACGYFDLATPFTATEYCFKHLHLPLDHAITLGYYEGGHMFYTNPAALKKFKNDMIIFFGNGSI
jgi:carboxypeptidase C (cathepsin A)